MMAVATILSHIITVYTWIVVISALISFVRPDPYNPIVRILYGLTHPVFYWLSKKFPFLRISGIDLSPLVLILALQFINTALVSSLYDFAFRMKMGI